MDIGDKEKLNTIENLKSKIFNKNFETKTERHDSFSYQQKSDVPESWEEDAQNTNFEAIVTKRASMFKKFFIFSIIFFILAIGYASYVFFIKGNTVSNDNIDIAILGNTFTAGGEELPLQIEVTNKNTSPLELADLLIEYPKSTESNTSGDVERIRSNLGTIPAGQIKTENVKLILFGEQGTIRPLKVSLEYRVEGSNAIFIKDKPYQVTISSAPIDLSIDAPTEVSPNQEVNLKVKASLNATKAASKILVRIDYPVGFEFTSATPAPSYGNNIWNLGDLSPGTEREIAIMGKMVDVSDGEEKTFHIFSGSQSDSDKSAIGVIFNSLGHTLVIKKPFIEAKLYINGTYQKEYAANANSTVSGEIHWVNNLDTKINDLEIQAKVSGNALNRNKISSQNGFYNSVTDTIIWDKNSEYGFAEVNPGDSGSVSFSLTPLSLFSSSAGLMTDPSINVDVSISGKQPEEGNSLKELTNSESKVIKIISDIGFTNKALYYSGPFTNTGPIPPKVEQETTYTVVWSLFNTANSISGVKIVSTLPQWVRFVGPASPTGEDLNYNSATGELTWTVGSVPKGTGMTEGDKEVSFQIAFTPSLSQVGTAPTIINDAILTGHDDFANVDVRVSKPSLNTRLSNDPTFPALGDRVVN